MTLTSSDVLSVLLVEDMPADARLTLWAIRRMAASVRHLRVADEGGMRRALAEFRPDVILSDFDMPGFGGLEALAIARELAPDIPFVFVSGTMGEQVAINALQQGAVDYVFKDNLRHLPAAVKRALRLAEENAERARMQRALAESEARFRAIVETSKDWIWECDSEARITYTNDAIEEFLGIRADEILGRPAQPFLEPEAEAEVDRDLPRYVESREGWRDWRLAWRHSDGRRRVQESTGIPLFDAVGNVIGFRGINRDITERLRHEAKITALARIHALQAATAKAVLEASDRRQLLEAACRIAVDIGGFKAAGIGERQGEHLLVVARHGDPETLRIVAPSEPISLCDESGYRDHPGVRAFREGRRIAVEDFSSGDVAPSVRQEMLGGGIRSEVALPIGTPPWGLMALFSDRALSYDEEEVVLLERLASEIDHAVDFLAKGEQLGYLAYHHPRTGLPNAAGFHAHLRRELGDATLVVAVIEATRLDHVTSTRGRPFVDRLLVTLAERLATTGRIVAHSEGTRLLLAYAATQDPDAEMQVLDARLRELERSPIGVEDELVRLVLRSGMAVGKAVAGNSELLEASAASALARALQQDVRVSLYNDDMRRQAQRDIELEHALHNALERNEFELHYQPKFDARDHRVVGAEALLRWRHPREGLIPPSEFIPKLEQTGLIVPVGQWVAREALATGLAWRQAFDTAIRIAVNISPRELRHRRFLEQREALLAPHRGNQVLDFEITESLLMDNIERSTAILEGLRALGCRVAIDDFGTGYSALNYLIQLPVDTIKIDRSFVSQLSSSPQAMALTTNVINMAKSLGLDTIAEGVENEEQARLLHLLRCTAMQGYHFGKPLPADAFAREVLQGKR